MKTTTIIILSVIIGALVGVFVLRKPCPDIPPVTIIDTSKIDSLQVLIDQKEVAIYSLKLQIEGIQELYKQFQINASLKIKEYESLLDSLASMPDDAALELFLSNERAWRARRDSIISKYSQDR